MKFNRLHFEVAIFKKYFNEKKNPTVKIWLHDEKRDLSLDAIVYNPHRRTLYVVCNPKYGRMVERKLRKKAGK